MTSRVVEDFIKSISAKLVGRAKTLLSKKEKFRNLEFFFTYKIRDDTYFSITVSCEEYSYTVPELDLTEVFTLGETMDDVEAFLESYGTFLAWDYAKSHGDELEITPDGKID